MKEVLLIDLSSLFWSAHHATANDIASDAVALTMSAVRRCHEGDESPLVAICLDEGRSFRKDIEPSYKANRPEKDHAALNQLADTKRRLIDAGYLLWGAPGFEADDVIATAATWASEKGHPVHICTSDKDLLQLLSLPDSKVTRTYNTWDTWRSATVVEKFGVEPDGLGDYLALIGDKSDGIEGADGIGPKTAKKLLIEHHSLERLYDRLDALAVTLPGTSAPIVQTMTPEARKVATPTIVQSLWDNREKVILARKLVELRTDAPIKFDEIFETRTPKAAQEMPDMDDKFEDDRISVPSAAPPPTAEVKPRALGQHPTGDGVALNPEAARGGEAATYQSGGVTVQRGPKDAAEATPTPAPAVSASAETALATHVTSVSYERALEPMSLGQTFKLAAELYKAGLYSKFATPQAIAAVMMRGRSMGIGGIAALDCFHVVEGRPFAYAYLIIAMAKADPDCEYFQMTEMVGGEWCTWETKNRRNPKPTRFTYTKTMAQLAGLMVKEKGNWNTRFDDMACKTAGAKLARIEYPASALGLISIEETGLE